MSLIGTIGAGLGAGAIGKVASGILDPVMQGIGNKISGGTWAQDANTIKQNEFNAQQAELARQWNKKEAEDARTFNREEAEKERIFEQEQAQINRDWQERMSNTAYQRSMEDMQKAGINPAMAYANGANGASTPSGNMASGKSASSGASSSATASGYTGGNQRYSSGSILDGVANVANVLNNDKTRETSMGFGQAMDMINLVGRLLKK